jgi:hypothetical protein
VLGSATSDPKAEVMVFDIDFKVMDGDGNEIEEEEMILEEE